MLLSIKASVLAALLLSNAQPILMAALVGDFVAIVVEYMKRDWTMFVAVASGLADVSIENDRKRLPKRGLEPMA